MRRVIPDAHKELSAPGATVDETIVRATARKRERAMLSLSGRTAVTCPEHRTNRGGTFRDALASSRGRQIWRRRIAVNLAEASKKYAPAATNFNFFGKAESLDRGARPQSKGPFASHVKVP
jgi:hypothetical protein